MPEPDARPNPTPPHGGRWQARTDSTDADVDEAEVSDIDALLDVLVVLRRIWESEPEDTPAMSCVVSIETDASDDEGVTWNTKRPSMAFGRGSWRAWCGRGVWSAPRFIAGLVVGGGIDAEARQAGLVRRARDRAVRKLGAPAPAGPVALPDLRDVPPAAVANGQLVVLVHGLCSTDVGTFADFETLLRGRPNVHVAGFPHDSLTTSIEDNARELAQVIRLLGKAGIRLVCHSRGGLVARRTHLLLQQKPPSAGAWIHSCVTFGTPHLGTSVASSPISLTFACMALAHLARSPGVASLVDVLCACTGEGLVGVSELLPSRVKDSYLARLEAAENRLFLNEGFNLHVFGSVAPQSSLWTRLVAGMITRVVGTPDHDLLVPTRSSLPRLEGVGPHAPIEGRSHFEYFTRQNAVDPPHFAAAVQRLGL